MILDPLLVPSARLGNVKGVHYLFMPGGLVELLQQCLSGFCLGDESKWNAIIQAKTQSFVVEATPHPIWYYLTLFLIGCLFFISLAFKPYHMVNSLTAQYLLWVFWFAFANQNSMSIWTSSQPNLKFAWWNTLQQSVDTTVTIFCWKVALAEMLIVVLDNQKQPSEVFCKEIVLKNFSDFTGKPVPSSLQLY